MPWMNCLRPHSLSDSIDRLNYLITALLLFGLCIVVSAKQYFGSPIECWTPLEFKSAWEQYVESYCFGTNAYTFPSEDEIDDGSERSARAASVYQWIPIILAIQAIMFYLPHFIWILINKLTVDLECVIADAGKMRKLPEDQRRSVSERIATYLYDAAFSNRSNDRSICKCIKGNWCAAALYFCTKISYVANLLLQILLITYIVGNGNFFWALKATNSPSFPQETLCDVSIRRSGGLSRYTMQCTLSINELNEIIYRFLWFWFLAVLSVSLVNLIYTTYHIFIPTARLSTCKRWLSTHQTSAEEGENLMIYRFASSGVQPDTTLAMRFIEAEAGAIVTKEIADALFQKFTDGMSLGNETPSTAVVHGNK
ncbi:hypothetical protein PRIPAC_86444 [Pristionchus pacificus]|uniref:Innexin n=1 Tax=Pristionchus pacificus TaxID=54126 RepID=A0A2A6BVE4_PRIPA|nr:hypothetical protein PRIPAC_86444 [Pristionchus pacificus]|eukprot:PDM69796.1 Innexin [Pristionchus pacificus]